MATPKDLWLGIESSCDESATAVFSPQKGVLGEWVSSQVSLHGEYGGVVPDLATRAHLRNFPVLCQEMNKQVSWDRIGQIAVTNGPGLAGCLALGIALAKSLSLALEVPLRAVNHLRGHAFSPFIDIHRQNPDRFSNCLAGLTPHLGLLVSGGHTVLFSLERDGLARPLAATVDDAAGEALDKGAKLLGMPYPGGALIEKEARTGDPALFPFPRALLRADERKFSFSGLKTSLRYLLEKMDEKQFADSFPSLCASYQQAVVDVLVTKTRQALESGGFRSLGLSGGVSNNQVLRRGMAELARERGIPFLPARPEHTGDNAAMIAFASWADPLSESAEKGHEVTLHPVRELAQA